MNGQTSVRRKTDPSHKAQFSIGVVCRCSCGWSSSTWFNKGAKSSAAAEWHMHRDKCDAAQNGPAK